MNTMRMMFLAAVLAMAGSCAKETTDQPAPTDPQTQPAPTPPEIPDQDLPVATDFEGEAEKQITAENYKGELDTLEQEIAAE
jgi:glucose/arabinose dehydrogenase